MHLCDPHHMCHWRVTRTCTCIILYMVWCEDSLLSTCMQFWLINLIERKTRDDNLKKLILPGICVCCTALMRPNQAETAVVQS